MEPLYIHSTRLKEKPIHELPYNPRLKPRAIKLRKARNFPEVLFWMQVTKGKFHEIDFDRQRVIGNFIVDFYIKRLGLVIEVDSKSHDDKLDDDRAREAYHAKITACDGNAGGIYPERIWQRKRRCYINCFSKSVSLKKFKPNS